MALNYVRLCAGDQGGGVTCRPFHSARIPPVAALAMVSGDSFLVARSEGCRAAGVGWSPARGVDGRGHGGRRRSRPPRFSPYRRPACTIRT
ncbi:uncharacterized protein C11orf71 homolog [Saccopteryx leptura]|uniref:uncharacterized protein C11orf71 homolog n=1 Tax=Saccopteryx leptura TaxID=249018 RepID=UPI00339BDED6